jgi:hypothetical protein
MRTFVVILALLVAFGFVHHGHPWQLLPVAIVALGAYIMADANQGPNTDARLAGAMVGFPILVLGLFIELFFVLDWLIFG